MENKSKRRKGKSKDDNYEQVTAYIRKDTHKTVKIELLRRGTQNFSELIQELLSEWISSNPKV